MLNPTYQNDWQPSRGHLLLRYISGITVGIIAGVIQIPNYARERGFFLDDQSIAFPMEDETCPTWPCLTLILILVPIGTIVIVETLFVKRSPLDVSWRDVIHNIFSILSVYLWTYAVTQFLTSIIKILVGKLRPDFLARCEPDPRFAPGFQTGDICEGDSDDINNGRMSFPSGHASTVFAAMLFCILYVRWLFPIRDTTFSELFSVPLQLGYATLAIWVASTRLIDYRHADWDVLGGAALGILVALVVFWQLTSPRKDALDEEEQHEIILEDERDKSASNSVV